MNYFLTVVGVFLVAGLFCIFNDAAPQLKERVGKSVELISRGDKVVVAEENQLTCSDKARLKELLLTDKGYYFDRVKNCPFTPEMVFSFEGVNVEVCTQTNQLKFVAKGENGNEIVLDYDPMAEAFNAYIQTIREKIELTKI